MLKIKYLKHDQREKAFLPMKGITNQIAADLYLAIKYARKQNDMCRCRRKIAVNLEFYTQLNCE